MALLGRIVVWHFNTVCICMPCLMMGSSTSVATFEVMLVIFHAKHKWQFFQKHIVTALRKGWRLGHQSRPGVGSRHPDELAATHQLPTNAGSSQYKTHETLQQQSDLHLYHLANIRFWFRSINSTISLPWNTQIIFRYTLKISQIFLVMGCNCKCRHVDMANT